MEKNVKVSMLCEIYGKLLTEKQLEILKSLTPTPVIKYQISLYENILKKAEANHEKEQGLKEIAHDAKLRALTADYYELQSAQVENADAIRKAITKLEAIVEKRQSLEDYANDKTAKAISGVRDAINERDSEDKEMDE